MSKFTPVYQKAAEVFAKQKFAEPEWQTFVSSTLHAKALFSPAGFDSAYAHAPDALRKKLDKDARNWLIAALVGGGQGDVIYHACQNRSSPGDWKERAGALVMLRHLFRAVKKGGQDVWVYSPPKALPKPVFDEFTGKDESVKQKIGQTDGIFGARDMKLMTEALTVARKCAMDALVKVDAKAKTTKDMVKFWFLDDDCGDTELDAALTRLSEGLKKISASCGSSCLVFTDYLDWRKQRNDYFGAAFRGGEGGGFPVIYLEGAFTRLKGNSGKLWLCAQTIVHELSHHDVSTHDHRYDHHGLKPSKSAFPYAKTIENADSWGYFTLDLAGYLSKSDRENVWK
jgi:hypothetical protein